MKIYPSLLASNLLELKETITSLESHCDGFHLDVMDNIFVPTLGFGPLWIKQIATLTKKTLSIHLMIKDVNLFLSQISIRDQDVLVVPVEHFKSKKSLINFFKKQSITRAISINPKTSLKKVFSFLDCVDYVQIMGVNPGFSGQDFLISTFYRLKQINNYKIKHKLLYKIGIDGGIKLDCIEKIVSDGCEFVAIGSALFQTNQDSIKLLNLFYKKSFF